MELLEPRRMTVRHHAAWISGAVLLVAALVLAGSGRLGNDDSPASPADTVAEFLHTAIQRHDAVGACDFLAPTARDALGGASGCPATLAAFARRAPAGLAVKGSGRRVVVDGLARPYALELGPLPVGSRPAEVAPASGWRIRRGIAEMVTAGE
jgi:hypothetical protein